MESKENSTSNTTSGRSKDTIVQPIIVMPPPAYEQEPIIQPPCPPMFMPHAVNTCDRPCPQQCPPPPCPPPPCPPPPCPMSPSWPPMFPRHFGRPRSPRHKKSKSRSRSRSGGRHHHKKSRSRSHGHGHSPRGHSRHRHHSRRHSPLGFIPRHSRRHSRRHSKRRSPRLPPPIPRHHRHHSKRRSPKLPPPPPRRHHHPRGCSPIPLKPNEFVSSPSSCGPGKYRACRQVLNAGGKPVSVCGKCKVIPRRPCPFPRSPARPLSPRPPVRKPPPRKSPHKHRSAPRRSGGHVHHAGCRH